MMTRPIYIYTRQATTAVGDYLEDDEMLDFEDIGGVYGSVESAAANVSALNMFLSSGSNIHLRFGGPKNPNYNNRRMSGVVYFNAPIVVAGSSTAEPRIVIDGAGSRLIGTGMTSAVTPLFNLTASGPSRLIYIHDMQIESDGAGVNVYQGGAMTTLENLRITATGAGVMSNDAWTDMSTASYGVKITDCDGVTLNNVHCLGCANHGLLITDRWHDGRAINFRTHSCGGSGLKGQRLQGCFITGRCETNKLWGIHVRRCGISYYDGANGGQQSNTPNRWQFWFENNNKRSSTVLGASIGHGVRQCKVEESGVIDLFGYTGWGSNKIAIDEGSRNNCIITEGMQVAQSISPIYDLNTGPANYRLPNTGGGSAVDNFSAKWNTNPGLMPTVAEIGQLGVDRGFRITYPGNCWESTDTSDSAYWRPWGGVTPALFTPAAGDTYLYEVELSADTPLQNWCIGREESGSQRQTSTCVIFGIGPLTGAKVWVGLYNSKRRKFRGIVTTPTAVTSPICTPHITVWHSGQQNQSNFPQSAAVALTIHSLKFYRLSKTGA